MLGLAALTLWAWQQRPAALPDGWHEQLVAGGLLSLCSLFAYSARFRRVMQVLDLDVTRLESLRIVSFAVFCQFFVPLGAGAEIAKFLKLRGLTPQRRALVSAAAIVVEHLLGLLALVATASVLFAILRPFAMQVNVLVLVLGTLAIVVLAATILLRRQAGTGLHAGRVLAGLRAHKCDAALALVWSLLMHMLLAAAVYVASQGWAMTLGYWQILLVLSAAGVFQAVPATLVGVGVADVAGTGLYVALGLPLSSALVLVSLLYSYRLLIALLGGLWELGRARRARVAAQVRENPA